MALALLLMLLQAGGDGRDAPTFKARVAEFDARERERAAAVGTEARGQATLAWLRALEAVLRAVPIERTDDPIFATWLNAHEEIVVYSEPSGEWLISEAVVWKLHDEHRGSAAADEIAWLGATNGIPGECEGYVPCYAARVNYLEGEYLRRHRDGRHRAEALAQIEEALKRVLDDLLTRPDRAEYLKVPDDCGDLTASLVPLRRAVSTSVDGAAAPALHQIDRLSAFCTAR